jgi:hypothetical protein
MRTLNRAAFIIRPRQPYLQWAASIDDDAPSAAAELHKGVSIYLVPEHPTGTAETPPLEEYYEAIFAIELEAWSTDEGDWPKDRGLDTFNAWFQVLGESMVIDLAEEAVEVEET